MLTISPLFAILVAVAVAMAAPEPNADCKGGIPPNTQILILEPQSESQRVDNNIADKQDEISSPDFDKAIFAKKCARNEIYTTCKGECQKYCDLQMMSMRLPEFCTGKCVSGCTCRKGYVRPPPDAPFKECISVTTCKGLIEAAQSDQE